MNDDLIDNYRRIKRNFTKNLKCWSRQQRTSPESKRWCRSIIRL